MQNTDGEHNFTTTGVSTDVIDASFKALIDAFEYRLMLL